MRKVIFSIGLKSKVGITLLLAFTMIVVSCDFIDDLPEANSIADATPPTAAFSFSSGVEAETFTQVSFANESNNATSFTWDFGDGNTSTDFDPVNVYPGEGSFTVTLDVSDALGQTSTFSQIVELIEPEAPAVPDPILLNPEFENINRMGSVNTCSCAGWINTDVGEQGETSSIDGASVLKFDNAEPDHVYQEFAVTPNADYRVEIPYVFQSDIATGNAPSQLEIRVLAGEGYVDGYTPTFFESTLDIPTVGFGYTSVAQATDAANNLDIQIVDNPDSGDLRSFAFVFNSGSNDSVAFYIRGIGNSGPEDPADFERYGFASGDEEIRIDSITITAVN